MLILGIAGGTGCGKTTVVEQIIDQIPDEEVGAVVPVGANMASSEPVLRKTAASIISAKGPAAGRWRACQERTASPKQIAQERVAMKAYSEARDIAASFFHRLRPA